MSIKIIEFVDLLQPIQVYLIKWLLTVYVYVSLPLKKGRRKGFEGWGGCVPEDRCFQVKLEKLVMKIYVCMK